MAKTQKVEFTAGPCKGMIAYDVGAAERLMKEDQLIKWRKKKKGEPESAFITAQGLYRFTLADELLVTEHVPNPEKDIYFPGDEPDANPA